MVQELLYVQTMDLDGTPIHRCLQTPQWFRRSKTLLPGNDPHPNNQRLPVRDVAAVVLRVGRPPGQ